MTDFPGWNQIATTYAKAYMRERLVWDTFSHAETDSWGNTETATTTAWTLTDGTAANFDIAAGVGTISLDVVNDIHFVTAGAEIGDVDVYFTVTVPVVATGSNINVYAVARFVDSSNYYRLQAAFDTSGNIDLTLSSVIGGSASTLDSAANVTTYAAGDSFTLHLRAHGDVLKGKVWAAAADDESDDWQVEATEGTFAVGGTGIRAILQTGNSNSTPVVLTFDDYTAYSKVDWVDITTYVSIAQGAGADVEGFVGRQTELSDIEPSRLSFAMKNQNGWFTPDNVTSPYYPDWGTGTRLRWSETIGARSFAFPDMWLEIPEVALTFEAESDSTLTDRMMRLSAVDLMTRLNNAPTFNSSLAGYIIGEATEGALRAYWPLTDVSGSTYATSAGPINQDPLRYHEPSDFQAVKFNATLVNFGEQDGPLGDDGSAVEFAPVSSTIYGRLGNNEVRETTMSDTVFATAAVWIYVPATNTIDDILIARDFDTFAIGITLGGDGAGLWNIAVNTLAGSDIQTGPEIAVNRWHLAAGQVDFSTGDYEFWVDDFDAVTGNAGGLGSESGDLPFDRLVVDGGAVSGVRVAHAQIYVGDSDAFTREDFLAQYSVGYSGWPIQRVDERIRQIATYAGLVDGQLDLEESDSLIQDPAWSGQSPGSLISAAATTGGGLVFTEGDRLIYHDRKHRFNL